MITSTHSFESHVQPLGSPIQSNRAASPMTISGM